MVQANLHDYQKKAIVFALNTPKCGLFLDMGLGKAIRDTDIVPTPNGFQHVNNLKIGDELYQQTGETTKITHIYKHPNKKYYRVTLTDQRTFDCCDEHLIPIIDERSNDIIALQLKDVVPSMRIPNNKAIVGGKDLTHPTDIETLNQQEREQYLLSSKLTRNRIYETYIKQVHPTQNKRAAQFLQDLVYSLGKTAIIEQQQDTYTVIETNDKYATIESIEYVGQTNMRCFTVDNDDHLFLLNHFIVTHNTLITLTTLKYMSEYGLLTGHVLIIAPATIAKTTWDAEIKKWDHTKNANYIKLVGLSRKKRLAEYDKIKQSYIETKKIKAGLMAPEERTIKPAIYILNRELTTDIVKFFGSEWPFQTLVIDELQSFKKPQSLRTKALRKVAPLTERIIGLTGTPVPTSLMDIWSQVWMLDNGLRLGKSFSMFKNNYFIPGRATPQGVIFEWFLAHGSEEQIYNNISDIVISMKSKDYLQLPPVTYNYINTDMTDTEKKLYNKFKKEMILNLTDGEVSAANAAVLAGKLQQLSNGAIYYDEDKSQIAELHEHKLDELEQIIDSAQGQPIIVFYWFKHDVQRITNRIPDAVVFDKTTDMVDSWNRKEIPILLLQPRSSAQGINLQQGGHIIVWFSLPTSDLEYYQQGNARLARQGQTEPVIIHHILTNGTIDARLVANLDKKNDMQESLLHAVKASI